MCLIASGQERTGGRSTGLVVVAGNELATSTRSRVPQVLRELYYKQAYRSEGIVYNLNPVSTRNCIQGWPYEVTISITLHPFIVPVILKSELPHLQRFHQSANPTL